MFRATLPLDVVAFEAQNSRAYLRSIFKAWRDEFIITNVPKIVGTHPGLNILSKQQFSNDPGWFDETLGEGPADALSQVAFSSGTTGTPKALVLTHSGQWDVVRRINAEMEVDSTIREYIGVPVTFSFGFGRVRAVAAAGGRSFLPANGFDPTEISAMLRNKEINAVSAVPTLWRLVLANPNTFGTEAKTLKWIEIGSQYMSGTEKDQLRRLFPNANIVQHYGLTEASRSTLLNISNAPKEQLESVGRASGAVKVKISPEGKIQIRGPHLAEGLLKTDEIVPLVDTDGWLTTSDNGELKDGWLYYKGRADELINVGGVKVDPALFEQRLTRRISDPDTVAVGKVKDDLRGEKILIAVESDSPVAIGAIESTSLEIAEDLGLQGKGALTFRSIESIPRTVTGKVKRSLLPDLPNLKTAPSFSSNKAQGTVYAPAADAAGLQKIWAEVLRLDHVPLDMSFYDLGGDSLSALTTILRMEALGINPEIARSIFDGKTISQITDVTASGGFQNAATAEVASQASHPNLGELVNTVHAVRGILIFWVVIIHWLPGVMTRLGDTNLEIYRSAAPLWRFGTPGFAMVFGVGIGALRLRQYADNKQAALRSTRLNTWVVLGGVTIMALLQMALLWSDNALSDRLAPSTMFYSAVTYYAIALLTMPWTLRILSMGEHRLITILLAAVTCFAIHKGLHASFAHLSPSGYLELLKVLFTAKYGFFQMTGYMLLGTAAGWILRQRQGDMSFQRNVLKYGATCIATGLLLYAYANQSVISESRQLDLRSVIIYLGVLLLLIGGFLSLNQRSQRATPAWQNALNKWAIAAGILALPVFVGHELVIPLKDLLSNLGLPNLLALSVPMALFLGATGVAYRRVLNFLE